MSKFLSQNLNYRVHVSTFRAENNPKSWPFKVEKNALILPKQLWKSPENDFFDPQNGQKLPLKIAKISQFVTEFSILVIIYRSLGLKITPKVGLSRSKTMPKHFLNNSYWKSQKNHFFDPQNDQNMDVNLAKCVDFSGPFCSMSSIRKRPLHNYLTINNASTVQNGFF